MTSSETGLKGPLKGLRIVEMVGVGPGPFCAMMLADMGAQIIRIDRLDRKGMSTRMDILNRGRRSLAIDLKRPGGVDTVLRLVDQADGLVEGFRPGVMERLGLAPELCLQRNPKLVFARITGWGQTGPLGQTPGHDINYIALAGALHAIGLEGQAPTPPLNLIGDFGGGGMLAAFGMLCALHETGHSGKGQVVDTAMIDGSALLMAMTYGYRAKNSWTRERGENLFDGGAHFYCTYQCSDGKWIAVGAIEPQFYAMLREHAGLVDPMYDDQWDRTRWPDLKKALAKVFLTRSREEWCTIFDGFEACVTPVLEMDEAPGHPQNSTRAVFTEIEGVVMPSPAPRFSRTPGHISSAPPIVGEHSKDVLSDWGFRDAEIAELEADGII